MTTNDIFDRALRDFDAFRREALAKAHASGCSTEEYADLFQDLTMVEARLDAAADEWHRFRRKHLRPHAAPPGHRWWWEVAP